MPIWKIPKESPEGEPVDKAPEQLADWSVLELPSGARHLCGCVYGPGWREGRVSSAVASWDYLNALATTNSGREYRLLDRPGGNLDADYVRNNWVAIQQAGEPVDVSREIWAAIEAVRPPEVALGDWRLIRIAGGVMHAVGMRDPEDAGADAYVTPPINWRYDRRLLRSPAGHPYRLHGAPGSNALVTGALEHWLRAHGVDEWEDITDAHWTQVQRRQRLRDLPNVDKG